MNTLFSGRSVSAIGLLLGLASMAFAVGYLQMIEYLQPCLLCVLDRAVVIGLCVVFLMALIHNPLNTGRKVYATLASLLSLTGIGICARHIWLQNLPKEDAPTCGAGFSHMLQTMPTMEFLDKIFNSTGECTDIQWQFLGMSIPELTLILFIVFLLLSLTMFFTTGDHKRGNEQQVENRIR